MDAENNAEENAKKLLTIAILVCSASLAVLAIDFFLKQEIVRRATDLMKVLDLAEAKHVKELDDGKTSTILAEEPKPKRRSRKAAPDTSDTSSNLQPVVLTKDDEPSPVKDAIDVELGDMVRRTAIDHSEKGGLYRDVLGSTELPSFKPNVPSGGKGNESQAESS